MAQKETIEFVAKVDDQSNQVVPTSQVGASVPNSPVPVDVGAGVQDSLTSGLLKEATATENEQLDELIKSSIAREAQLKVLREINANIKSLEKAGSQLPESPSDLQLDDDELFTNVGGIGNPPPPNDPPSTGFFDDEDNRFDNLPDLEEETRRLQEAFEDLVLSFNNVKVDNGPQVDLNEFDANTAEFDKTFADMDAVEDTMASLNESLQKPLEVLGILTPELTLFVKGVTVATGAISGLVVATQLYSSVLAATVENFGELSAELKQAQAETEVARVQQQLQFAEKFGDVLADMERNRNDLRDAQRTFLAELLAMASPWIDAISAGFTAAFSVLNAILAILSPLMEAIKFQMKLLEGIFKTINYIATIINPFKWFQSDEIGDNTSVWDNITAPENFLDVDNIRPTNVNGRDVYDMDDLMKKNL